MTTTHEFEAYGHAHTIRQDQDGFYHVDMDGREDIHGAMPPETLVNYLVHVIQGLDHSRDRLSRKLAVVPNNTQS